jgi:hypothetical protein
MALLEILTRKERKLFDFPPQFSSTEERKKYFSLDDELNTIIEALRGTTNKIGFILQFGYFKCGCRFYSAKDFYKKDINFIINHFGFLSDVDFEKYNATSYARHQKLILEYLGYSQFDKGLFTKEIERLANKYIRPKQILLAINDSFRKIKMVLPSYNAFAEAITAEYNKIENILLDELKQQLTEEQLKNINELLPNYDDKDKKPTYKRSVLTSLRYVKQSIKPKDIKFNIQNFIKIKNLYLSFKTIIDNIAISKEAISYYAIWAFKARAAQVVQFSNIYKRALIVLSFIAYQYHFSQDTLVDIFLRAIQKFLNNIEQLQKDHDFEHRDTRNKSIKLLAESGKKSRNALGEIRKVAYNSVLTDKSKIIKIKSVLTEDQQEFDLLYAEKFDQLEIDTENAIKGKDYYDFMEKLSIKLQIRGSDIIKQLEFNKSNSDQNIIAAIEFYKKTNGKVDNKAPVSFIEPYIIEYLYDSENNFRPSLYKAILFVKIAEFIKSGKLNLLRSYRYLSIDEYLISSSRWKREKTQLLKTAGLSHLTNIKKLLKKHRKLLNERFEITNKNILNGKNQYIKVKEDGSFIVSTPAVDKLETAKISSFFDNDKYTPIIQVLHAINEATGFVDAFKHYTIKHNKPKPDPNIFLAGIIALGCNIGVRKMANISIGISESTLVRACNWYFSIDNLNDANDQIIRLINKLSLPDLFIKQKNLLHGSGDAKKVVVSADSLNANFSFKYYGNSKGASVYSFIDERHVLFHSLVFSSSDREAGYVVDGLLCNEEIKVDIFSTDTHGYSEIIFAVTELLGISFAPRIKKSQEQLLYAFETKQSYNKKGYSILPSKKI